MIENKIKQREVDGTSAVEVLFYCVEDLKEGLQWVVSGGSSINELLIEYSLLYTQNNCFNKNFNCVCIIDQQSKWKLIAISNMEELKDILQQ